MEPSYPRLVIASLQCAGKEAAQVRQSPTNPFPSLVRIFRDGREWDRF